MQKSENISSVLLFFINISRLTTDQRLRFKQVAFLRLNQIYYGLDYDFVAQIFFWKKWKNKLEKNQWNWAILTDYIIGSLVFITFLKICEGLLAQTFPHCHFHSSNENQRFGWWLWAPQKPKNGDLMFYHCSQIYKVLWWSNGSNFVSWSCLGFSILWTVWIIIMGPIILETMKEMVSPKVTSSPL